MTDRELATLKTIQLNIRDDLNSLHRDILIFKLENVRAYIDRLISDAEKAQELST